METLKLKDNKKLIKDTSQSELSIKSNVITPNLINELDIEEPKTSKHPFNNKLNKYNSMTSLPNFNSIKIDLEIGKNKD